MKRRANRLFKSVAFAVALGGAAGCAQQPAIDPSRAMPSNSVCIVLSPFTNAFASASREVLADLCPGAAVFSSENIGAAFAKGLSSKQIVLFPDIRNLPVEAWPSLVKFLGEGGAAVFWGTHPLEGSTRRGDVEWPDIPMLSPPYRHYSTAIRTIEFPGTSNQAQQIAATVQCPIRRALGTGGERGAPYRWIPLATGLGASRDELGAPVSLFVEPKDGAEPRQWAWVGIDPTPDNQGVVADCLRAALTRVKAGQYLHKAGAEQFSFKPGDPLDVSARWIGGLGTDASLRVQAELVDQRGDVQRRIVSAPLAEPVAPGQGFERLSLGPAPAVEHETRKYTVRISLLDRSGAYVYDRIDQPVRMLPPADSVKEEWITASGPLFTIAGRPLSFLGVNYWPLNAAGYRPGEFHPHWLDAAVFDPEQVVRDLESLRGAGVNAISVQYLDEAQAPQLRYVIEEARLHRMWTHVFVEHLQPLDQDLAKAERMIRAADLADLPRVFALDVAWEPHLGKYEDRRRFDGAWASWIDEQFGSVAHAESVLARPLWRRDGTLTGPPDNELSTDGAHRPEVAVYRRFVDDYMSRRYGEVVRFLRRMGLRQLISARTGYGGTGNHWADPYFPIDPASGATHFDFISPEGWGLEHEERIFKEASFLTAYCRGVTGGKPVAWLEFGSSVGPSPEPVDFRNQVFVYRNMFDLLMRSRSSACFAWWYPGGLRVDEGSDFGIVNPDGTWRAVLAAFSDLSFRLRQANKTAPPWQGREVDRDADARGLSGLWDHWRDTCVKEAEQGLMQEVRPVGYARETKDIDIRSVGGASFQVPAPMALVNAEWGRIDVDGTERPRPPGEFISVQANQKLNLELINTGSATWSASSARDDGTAWVEVSGSGSRKELLRLTDVPPGGRASVTWSGADAGTWTLRPCLSAVGGFGEPLRVDIVAAP